MRKPLLIIIIILLGLVFAWWAAGEIYNPRPTPTPNIILPTKVIATEIVYPVATKSPTPVTIATQTITPVLITATVQAPTYTPTHSYVPPTATPFIQDNTQYLSIIPDRCLRVRGDKWFLRRLLRCNVYSEAVKYYPVYVSNGDHNTYPVPYSTPHGTIIAPPTTPRP